MYNHSYKLYFHNTPILIVQSYKRRKKKRKKKRKIDFNKLISNIFHTLLLGNTNYLEKRHLFYDILFLSDNLR